MDKISKALKKIGVDGRRQIKNILQKLNTRCFDNLDIKKLKGREDIFRIRKGNIRIIYRKEDNNIFVLAIDHRREDTYKHS